MLIVDTLYSEGNLTQVFLKQVKITAFGMMEKEVAKFRVSLGYTARPWLKKKKKKCGK